MKALRYIILFIICFKINVIAQNDCKGKITLGKEYFNLAEYNNCIKTLSVSLNECFYSKKEKEDIYELLIKAYLEVDKTKGVDYYAKKLLENNPSYELKEAENTEDFNRLIKRYNVHPKLSFGIRNTVLIPSFSIGKTYSILDNVDYKAKYQITTKTLLMYYGWAEFQFNKSLAITAEFTGLSIQYQRSFSKPDWQMNYSERMSFIEMPLYLKKYLFYNKTVYPFAYAGMSYLRLVQAKSNANISYVNESYITGEKVNFSSSLSDIDMMPMRNKNNVMGVIGAGVGFRFKNFGIYIDARYYKGINNLINTSNRFYNQPLINDYFYIDNAVILSKFEAGLTISYTLKNSVKKS